MLVPFLQYYSRNGTNWGQVILIALIILAVLYAINRAAPIKTVLSHWHHRFDTVLFSPQEFYQGIVAAIKSKEMNKLSMYEVTYAEGGFLSPRRLYLRITYKDFIYDICAAPFGKEFFVSWWLGEREDATRSFLMKLPLIGNHFAKRPKTFFELDTEIMFKEAVTSCVKSVIDQLTQTKGMRQLVDADWKEYNRMYQ